MEVVCLLAPSSLKTDSCTGKVINTPRLRQLLFPHDLSSYQSVIMWTLEWIPPKNKPQYHSYIFITALADLKYQGPELFTGSTVYEVLKYDRLYYQSQRVLTTKLWCYRKWYNFCIVDRQVNIMLFKLWVSNREYNEYAVCINILYLHIYTYT